MSDLTPVFEIKSSSMIGDDDAEEMESAIVQNQDKMSYWTNFDSWIDWVTLLFWVGGIAMIAMGMIGAGNAPPKTTHWPLPLPWKTPTTRLIHPMVAMKTPPDVEPEGRGKRSQNRPLSPNSWGKNI